MKVFYDHQAFSLQDYGGITRIFSELYTGLQQRKHSPHLSILFSNNAYINEKKISPNPFYNIWKLKHRSVIYKINNAYNVFDLIANNYDVYHPTYYSPFLSTYIGNTPMIVTVHDLINEILYKKYPSLYDSRLFRQKQTIMMKAAHIIAVSENTKKDVIEHYSIEPEKISVIYLGNSFSIETTEINKSTEKYMLFVGNRAGYKNFIPFVEAIHQILIDSDIKLICAGGKEFTNEEKEVLKRLGIDNRIHHQSVNDSQLSELYKNALLFIFPSLYEGFGIPILEAFACGCPCAVSNSGSLPEIAGDAALFFDPYSMNSIFECVYNAINSTELRENLRRKGRIRLANFSWDKHIEQTIEVYNKVI
jgi:glycosyltransferase involved in cell wall biosynthesis